MRCALYALEGPSIFVPDAARLKRSRALDVKFERARRKRGRVYQRIATHREAHAGPSAYISLLLIIYIDSRIRSSMCVVLHD